MQGLCQSGSTPGGNVSASCSSSLAFCQFASGFQFILPANSYPAPYLNGVPKYASVEACQQLCTALTDPPCAGFVYNSALNDGMCYPKVAFAAGKYDASAGSASVPYLRCGYNAQYLLTSATVPSGMETYFYYTPASGSTSAGSTASSATLTATAAASPTTTAAAGRRRLTSVQFRDAPDMTASTRPSRALLL